MENGKGVWIFSKRKWWIHTGVTDLTGATDVTGANVVTDVTCTTAVESIKQLQKMHILH